MSSNLPPGCTSSDIPGNKPVYHCEECGVVLGDHEIPTGLCWNCQADLQDDDEEEDEA